MLKCWPEIYVQCGALLNAFDPVLIRGVENEKNHPGSNSHQPPGTLNAIWATVHNPVLLAQAIVHEMAHVKLFSLGLHFENVDPLFENDPAEQYDSPIRLDIPRPISAVFHGVYAFTHVLALDLKMLASRPEDKGNEILSLIHYNAQRMTKGVALIEKCARLSEKGKWFMPAFLAWARDLIQKANRIVAERSKPQAGPWVLIGPAGGGKTTLADRLGAETGKEIVILDQICWEVWWESSIIQRKLLQNFGTSALLQAITQRNGFSKQELLWNWMKQGVISVSELDILKLQLAHFALKTYPTAIIEFGAGFCIFRDTNYLQQLRVLLKEVAAKVFLIRPVASLKQTLELLEQRLVQLSRPYKRQSISSSLENRAYRVLGDYVIDTKTSTPDSCAQDILAVGSSSR